MINNDGDDYYRPPDDVITDTLISSNDDLTLTSFEQAQINKNIKNFNYLNFVEKRMEIARENELAKQCAIIQESSIKRQIIITPIFEFLNRIKRIDNNANTIISLCQKCIEETLNDNTVINVSSDQKTMLVNFINEYYTIPNERGKCPRISNTQKDSLVQWFALVL